jgi:beta-lactamase superfamily II metal-dependent hydrolase
MGQGEVSVIARVAFIILFVIAAALSGCVENQAPQSNSVQKDDISAISHAANPADNLTVHFVDVGQGDSILVQFAGKNILVDGGESDMGSRVVSYLKSHNVSSLDLVVSNHPHSDHIGGLVAVLKSIPVRQVLDSGEPHISQTFENFLTLIEQKDIPFKVAKRGQVINLDPLLKIEVLNPPKAHFKDDLNDNSVVLRVTYGNVSFLLTGDAEKEAENSLLSSNYGLDSDVLKVGHHGSSSSSTSAFLQVVSPEVSVIEVGKGNDYGHPSSATLKALKNAGSAVYRTDLNGNIVVTTDGTNYFVTVQKGTAAPIVTPTPTALVSISATQFNAPGDDRANLNGEWVRVTNSGLRPIVIASWTLSDDSNQPVYEFPQFTLGSGASVTVFTGKGRDSADKLYMGRSSPIWNNDHDTAILKDVNGRIVSQRS